MDADGFVAAHSVTTIAYLIQKSGGRVAAAIAVSNLLTILSVVPTDAGDVQRALALGLNDFEDALQVAAGLKINATSIVTRNSRDYAGSKAVCLSAGEALALVRTAT
jgi:predicted nucleic acid-binding protein